MAGEPVAGPSVHTIFVRDIILIFRVRGRIPAANTGVDVIEIIDVFGKGVCVRTTMHSNG